MKIVFRYLLREFFKAAAATTAGSTANLAVSAFDAVAV